MYGNRGVSSPIEVAACEDIDFIRVASRRQSHPTQNRTYGDRGVLVYRHRGVSYSRDIPLRIGPRPRACQTRLNPVFTTPWCEPESVRYPLYVHLCVHVRVRMCLFMHTSYLHIHDERARERTHELESERRHLNP